MRPTPPSTPEKPSQQLKAQIERDFGSMDDFRRALGNMLADPRRGGYVWLVSTPGGRLRLVRTPPNVTPRGKVLFRFPAPAGPHPPRPDWPKASDRYDKHMQHRPPIPMP